MDVIKRFCGITKLNLTPGRAPQLSVVRVGSTPPQPSPCQGRELEIRTIELLPLRRGRLGGGCFSYLVLLYCNKIF
jgi:hypothetical protein